MKGLIILISVLLISSFGLIPIFAEAADKTSESAAGAQQGPRVEDPARKGVAGINQVADTNTVADSNAPEVKPRWLEELEEALGEVNQQSQQEMREWMRGEVEHKMNLAIAVQEQVTAELNFIRELAVEEGAVKTTEAIDRLLASRDERLGEIVKKMEEERRRERLKEREEKRGRDREQRRKDREDRRTKERPSRRDSRE